MPYHTIPYHTTHTQGTAWYTKLKYRPVVEFGNLMNYTAMGVGRGGVGRSQGHLATPRWATTTSTTR